MFFNSLEFIIFFPIVVLLYYAIPFKFKWVFLLAASLFFYSRLQPVHLALLVLTSVVDYYLALRMESRPQGKKRAILILGLINNVGLLFLFKYLNFFSETLTGILELVYINYDIPIINNMLVPLGLSYFTFKKISYLVDVYRQNYSPEKHLGRFLLYVSFFPAVVAGPIDRAGELIPQFLEKKEADAGNVISGLQLVLWGFFKKLLIADNLAMVVNLVYRRPEHFEGIYLIIATVFFSFQIYCDFSGYSDIAIGIGRTLGFKLMNNFDRPYQASSISQFWDRWHISLTSWLRDYLFLPIAFTVSGKMKRPKVLHIKAETWAYLVGMPGTMFLCGLWHGARWTFLVWGLIHGIYLAASFLSKKKRARLRKRLKIKKNSPLYRKLKTVITFTLVTFSWIFFRAGSLDDAFYIVSHLFSGIPAFVKKTLVFFYTLNADSLAMFLAGKHLGTTNFNILVVMLAILLMNRLESAQKKRGDVASLLTAMPVALRWTTYLVLVFAVLIFGKFGIQDFIYAQF